MKVSWNNDAIDKVNLPIELAGDIGAAVSAHQTAAGRRRLAASRRSGWSCKKSYGKG